MTDALNRSELSRHPGTSVVLLAPELFASSPDTAGLIDSLTQPHTRVRLLVRLAPDGDLTLPEALARAGVAIQVLVPAGITPSPSALPLVRMPAGSGNDETNDLALALSDCLLVPAELREERIVSLARALRKTFIVPGAELPAIRSDPSISDRLDPDQPGPHRRFRRLWGRPEQFLLELAAFSWRGPTKDAAARSRDRLRECALGAEWEHEPYFAPRGWQDLAPDRAALDAGRPIVAAFDQLDRSALFGSHKHRDLAWAAYLAAALAVLAAVAGHIELVDGLPRWAWPVAELAMLGLVLWTTISARSERLQDRWTACRFGAEQLRIARMCLPLLVIPRALCSFDQVSEPDESQRALAEVKRAVRDQGLPDLSSVLSALDAARWLDLVVADQADYHRKNHHRLECAEQRLNRLTDYLFALAVLAVGVHLVGRDDHWLLIFTAALPAFGAAVHGVTTRLGFVHRIQLSLDAERDLRPIHEALAEMIDRKAAGWTQVRSLAVLAGEAMAQETKSWHSQVRRQKDVIV
jgi:hypothetical protein